MSGARRPFVTWACLLPLLLGPSSVHAADVIETIRQAGKFETLVKVLEAAGGVGWLEQQEQLTFFAPTDAAFDKLKEGTLDRLTEPEHADELELLVEHHVVAGTTLASSDLQGHSRLEMAEGETLLVAPAGDSIQIGDATIVDPDIAADNGVIHAIDEVLVPELVWDMLERSR